MLELQQKGSRIMILCILPHKKALNIPVMPQAPRPQQTTSEGVPIWGGRPLGPSVKGISGSMPGGAHHHQKIRVIRGHLSAVFQHICLQHPFYHYSILLQIILLTCKIIKKLKIWVSCIQKFERSAEFTEICCCCTSEFYTWFFLKNITLLVHLGQYCLLCRRYPASQPTLPPFSQS